MAIRRNYKSRFNEFSSSLWCDDGMSKTGELVQEKETKFKTQVQNSKEKHFEKT